MGIIVFLVWAISAMVAAGFLADRKNRQTGNWIFLAFFIGWLSVIILACAKTLPPKNSSEDSDTARYRR